MPAPHRLTPRSLLTLALVLMLAWGASRGIGWWSEHRLMAQIRAQAQAGDIEMFTTADCVWCHRAARRLNEAGVVWQECRIDADAECARRHAASGGFGTPWFRVGTQWRAGFDPAWMNLALQGLRKPG